MRLTDTNLREQLHITDNELEHRTALLNVTEADIEAIRECRPIVLNNLDELVDSFYDHLVEVVRIHDLVSEPDPLARLKGHVRGYVRTLFEGRFDNEYVLSRLRIGRVHKRIGVSPKFYISAVVHMLARIDEMLLFAENSGRCEGSRHRLNAIHKVLMFDLTLVFDTYIASLVSEVERHSEELAEYAETLEETVKERTAQLEELARHDGLTGLLNQRSFFEELGREISRAHRRGCTFALLYIDADKFKLVNDTLGHLYGDDVLSAIASTFRKVLRPEDTPARYGGDEFCVILPEADKAGAQSVARRIIETFDATKPECDVTLSIGIVTFAPESGEDANSLLNRADQAMYESKKVKGHHIHLCSLEH